MPLIPSLNSSVWLYKIIVKTDTEDTCSCNGSRNILLFCCAAVGTPVQEWDLRSPPLVCMLAWDGLFFLWKIIIYQGYCWNGCNWSYAKFLLVLSTENTSRHNFSLDQLGSIMMVQWHCLKLSQSTCVCWENSLGALFFILLESGTFVWNWERSRICLWQTILLPQLVGSLIIWFLWLIPSLHSASLILNNEDSSIGWFVSVSFHWVKSDHMKHGSPDSSFYSQEASGLQHSGELLDEILFLTLY